MKILKILFLCIAVIGLSSCSDDDGPSVDDSLIVGTWSVVELNYSGTSVTDLGDGETISQDFTGEGFNFDSQVTFNEDNTYTSSGRYDVNLTSTVLGETFNQTVSGDDYFGSGEYEIDGSTITFIDGENVGTYEINELSENNLIITIETEELLMQSGFEITSTLQGVVRLTR